MSAVSIAVFGTRHILAERPCFTDQQPVFSEWYRGRRLDWYSTGKLEEAMAKSFEVYVVSIRPVFGPQDEWWLDLVGRSRSFNARNVLAAAASGDPMSAVYEPWRQLFMRLDIPWPEGVFNDFDDPAVWLASRCGVKDGSMFEGHGLMC